MKIATSREIDRDLNLLYHWDTAGMGHVVPGAWKNAAHVSQELVDQTSSIIGAAAGLNGIHPAPGLQRFQMKNVPTHATLEQAALFAFPLRIGQPESGTARIAYVLEKSIIVVDILDNREAFVANRQGEYEAQAYRVETDGRGLVDSSQPDGPTIQPVGPPSFDDDGWEVSTQPVGPPDIVDPPGDVRIQPVGPPRYVDPGDIGRGPSLLPPEWPIAGQPVHGGPTLPAEPSDPSDPIDGPRTQDSDSRDT